MPEDDGTDELTLDVNRRQFLASGATGVAAGGLFAGGTVAQTGRTVTVTQGGESFEVEPLQYENQSIEQFHSYDDPASVSANTPTGLERSDTSRVFFYEGPDGLSFVVIHDEPFDGDGGEVRFEFDGLSSGSWVVRDDPTSKNERSYSLRGVSWRWPMTGRTAARSVTYRGPVSPCDRSSGRGSAVSSCCRVTRRTRTHGN